MEKVLIGQITAPVGIKGEFRVFPYTDRNSRFSDIKKVYVGEDETPYDIEKYRSDKDMVVLKLAQVSDRNTSETLRGKPLYAAKGDYPLDEDAFFLEDLIGCRIVSDEDEELGVLVNIIQNTAQDIYEIKKPDGKTFLVPAVKEFVVNIDIDLKKITLHLIEGFL